MVVLQLADLEDALAECGADAFHDTLVVAQLSQHKDISGAYVAKLPYVNNQRLVNQGRVLLSRSATTSLSNDERPIDVLLDWEEAGQYRSDQVLNSSDYPDTIIICYTSSVDDPLCVLSIDGKLLERVVAEVPVREPIVDPIPEPTSPEPAESTADLPNPVLPLPKKTPAKRKPGEELFLGLPHTEGISFPSGRYGVAPPQTGSGQIGRLRAYDLPEFVLFYEKTFAQTMGVMQKTTVGVQQGRDAASDFYVSLYAGLFDSFDGDFGTWFQQEVQRYAETYVPITQRAKLGKSGIDALRSLCDDSVINDRNLAALVVRYEGHLSYEAISKKAKRWQDQDVFCALAVGVRNIGLYDQANGTTISSLIPKLT
jgi:hypothetical protein